MKPAPAGLPLKIVYLRRKRKGRYVENNDEVVDLLRQEVEYLRHPERFLGRRKTTGSAASALRLSKY